MMVTRRFFTIATAVLIGASGFASAQTEGDDGDSKDGHIQTASSTSSLNFLNGGSILDELGDLSAQVEANSEALEDL
ncbi:MAG: hypothetical protein VXX31_15930, partial [Planctomycetota bacterium]|nr:hypothetical protein [Planctomycetota bacterium]